jgi:hypothetical protein
MVDECLKPLERKGREERKERKEGRVDRQMEGRKEVGR